ncbi:MAG: uracil-DNA glycosylase [candidate division Zixibacteria bacterium]|nr:uracil-DNA glycosylase [candidate division Zixibacteria bacterium]
MRTDDRYEKMLEAFALAKNFLKQQVDLGFDEIYTQKASKKSNSKKLHTPAKTLADFYREIKDCKKCHLYKTRTNLVFGAGNQNAKVMFIGEAPGREEDLQGEPFVGKAGQLLDKILAAIKFSRDEVYIANILKCRPPENRDPLPDEIQTCEPHLLEQIRIIQPEIICALGRIAAQALLKTKLPLGQLRGKIHDYHGTKFLVTYHPAALLRYPQYKRATWEDVKLLKKEYDNLG